MTQTLRDLLIQRAARLQERPALTAPGWGTLSYAQLRNRVEGVALGLLAIESGPVVFSATGTAWAWDPAGQAVPPEIFGGSSFNDEVGRGPYHLREQVVQASTPFTSGLDHGEIMARLCRLNVQLGWDHATQVGLPLARLGEAPIRAALWSALYAGAHAELEPPSSGSLASPARWRKTVPPWDPSPFLGFWQS